ncbi:MAG TPA: hypothetical protein VF807_04490 [Ktedonobacterales bacterium]
MGLRDLPFWGRIAGELANMGLDSVGAKKCAEKGHRWKDVTAIVLREDGSVEELPKGAAQRCTRCGAERMADEQP